MKNTLGLMSIVHVWFPCSNRRIEFQFTDERIRHNKIRGDSPSHNVNGQDPALMARKQIIDKVANDRVRLVAQLCYDPANQSAATTVPFEIDRAVRGLTVDFRPAMRTTRTLVFSGNQIEPPKLWISHDFFPKRPAPGCDDLDNRLHFKPRFNRKPSSFAISFSW